MLRPKHFSSRPLKVTFGGQVTVFFLKVRDEQDLKKNQRRLILYVGDSGDETKQLFQTQSSNDDLENCCSCFLSGYIMVFCDVFARVGVFFASVVLRKSLCLQRWVVFCGTGSSNLQNLFWIM